jgi:hypothetical protein
MRQGVPNIHIHPALEPIPRKGQLAPHLPGFRFLILYHLFVKISTCNPIRLYWEFNRHDGTCLNRSAIIIADSVISVIIDLTILIFPIALTWTLHMSVAKKIHVIAILGAGGMAIIVS